MGNWFPYCSAFPFPFPFRAVGVVVAVVGAGRMRFGNWTAGIVEWRIGGIRWIWSREEEIEERGGRGVEREGKKKGEGGGEGAREVGRTGEKGEGGERG